MDRADDLIAQVATRVLGRGYAAASAKSYLSYESIMATHEGEEEGVFVNMANYGQTKSPEEWAMEHERWLRLRYESRELIELLINCPAEVHAEIVGITGGKLTAKKVTKWLRKKWRDRQVVREVIKDIRSYLNYHKGEVPGDRYH